MYMIEPMRDWYWRVSISGASSQGSLKFAGTGVEMGWELIKLQQLTMSVTYQV